MKFLLAITVLATIASATNLRGDEGHRQLPPKTWHKCMKDDDCDSDGSDLICCGSPVGKKCKNQCEWNDSVGWDFCTPIPSGDLPGDHHLVCCPDDFEQDAGELACFECVNDGNTEICNSGQVCGVDGCTTPS